MRTLITGISGFVGQHLESYLSGTGAEVWGIDRHLPHTSRSAESFFQNDLKKVPSLVKILTLADPDQVYHLAGVFGKRPYGEMHATNVVGTSNLLEAMGIAGVCVPTFIASSSAVYGATTPEDNPISENTPLRPISDYGISKVAQEEAALRVHRNQGLPIIIARTFNLVGPNLSPALLPSSIAQQIALAEIGLAERKILVGNVHPKRDYVDVRDAVRAYMALLREGTPGSAYNICTGESHSVQEVLDNLLSMCRVPVEVVTDPHRIRAEKVLDQVGDAKGLMKTTGWKPTIAFISSLASLLRSWRESLARENVT